PTRPAGSLPAGPPHRRGCPPAAPAAPQAPSAPDPAAPCGPCRHLPAATFLRSDCDTRSPAASRNRGMRLSFADGYTEEETAGSNQNSPPSIPPHAPAGRRLCRAAAIEKSFFRFRIVLAEPPPLRQHCRMDAFRETNRINWDERAPVHARSPEYGFERFAADPAYLS